MREANDQIVTLSARVITVGTGAEFQARRLMDDGMPFLCLVDPDARLHQALGIGRLGLGAVLNPRTYANYWRAWRRGARQGMITGDPRRLSGVAILDSDARLAWRHRSATIGDYPPIATVLAELARV